MYLPAQTKILESLDCDDFDLSRYLGTSIISFPETRLLYKKILLRASLNAPLNIPKVKRLIPQLWEETESISTHRYRRNQEISYVKKNFNHPQMVIGQNGNIPKVYPLQLRCLWNIGPAIPFQMNGNYPLL